MNQYDSTQAQSSIYTRSDGTKFINDGHHTTIASYMLDKGTGPFMGNPTTGEPSSYEYYWVLEQAAV